MNKKLSVLICMLIIIILFVGCSGGAVTGGTVAAGCAPEPFSVESIEEFHNFMLAVRAYANDGIMTYDVTDRRGRGLDRAIRQWPSFGDMERYYIPSWLPEELVIRHISFHSGAVAFHFYVDGRASDHITFTKFIRANAMRTLKPAVGVEGLYYSYFVDRRTRSYYWIQDGYMFRFCIPVRIIEAHGHPNDGFGRADEAPVGDSIAALVMGSAMAVELVDGQPYVPPTGIEIVAPAEDIAVGETLALTARVLPGNATIDAVFWNSSNNNNATVTQNGVVTRVGMGTATITARTVGGNLAATFVLGRAS